MRFRHVWTLILCLAIFGMAEMEAQYRGSNPYYGRRNSIVPSADDPKPEDKPLTAEEIVEKEMPKITEAAGLNDFEQAVVSSILLKYLKQGIELKLLELEPEKTREAMEKIRRNQKEELKAGLPEEKYNLIVEIQENGYRKVNKKKKKRKKDSDS